MILGRFCSGLAALGAMLLVASMSVAQAQGRFAFDRAPGYLNKEVVPSRYELRLDLDPALDTFRGEARISVSVHHSRPSIELHAFELAASEAHLVSGGERRALQVTALPETQTWRLVPTDGGPIPAGEHRLEFVYAGKVHVAGEGLFVAPYDVNGEPQRMLATQLEAIFARRLFPCFDEPAFRAVFEIAVRAPSALEVVSNMPRSSRRRDGATTLHGFKATPPMPSYLVSVAVGRFDALQGQAAGVPVQILTVQGKQRLGRAALRATRQVLPYFSQYFGVPYALPKLDLLAVPSVRWGAMEDWGLISFAEDDLLVDPQRSSPATLRGTYEVIAHEVAHQWFGNLVTAASWEEIWLNEAFATWLQKKATDRFNPAWQILLTARVPIDYAMTLDAGTATRAIRSGPVRESAVFDVFDPITYDKGGAVLSMLEQWIGPAQFQRGLVYYMKGQRLSNATAADLWHYMGRASGRDVIGVAKSWTDQQGFPLVQVSERCEGGRQRVVLAQTRFSNGGAVDSTQLWRIPVRYARGRVTATVLLDKPQHAVTLGACGDEPLIVNVGGIGFYRVAYEPAALAALTRRFVALAPADRATLLSDTFALVQAGRLPLPSYLAVLESLPGVTDASRTMLWSLARSELDFLDLAMAGRPAQQQVRAMGRRLLEPQLAQLGWQPAPNEDAQTAELRGTLIALLAKFDHAPTIAQALRAFDNDEAGTHPLPASMRDPVTVAVGMHADTHHFERLLTRFKAASGEEERWMLAKALASGRDAARAERLLGLSLEGLAPANVSSSIPSLVARYSPHGELAYRYALAHWQPLAAIAGTWGQLYLLPGRGRGIQHHGTGPAVGRGPAPRRRCQWRRTRRPSGGGDPPACRRQGT